MSRNAHDQLVRRSFESQVALFSGPDSPFARRPESTLAWLEPLDPEMRVLDVACGAGHGAEVAAPHVRLVVGIDLTPGLLEVGARRLREAGLSNVLLQEGNAHALPFTAGSFDLVFCRNSLHHVADPEQAVSEMVRVCRPGGRVVLADLVAPSPETRERFDALHRLLDPSHRRAFLEGELAALLPSALALTYGETSTSHFPLDIAVTGQSHRATVVAALRAELEGGPPTGFFPREEDGQLLVAFTSSVVHGTL
jgi:SAM-dependent methyltransferase